MPAPTIPGAANVGTERSRPDYSICTLVTDAVQYQACLASFHAARFNPPDCEFLYADNTEANAFDGYTGLNRFLASARGRTIILCHQDILVQPHGRAELDACIADMNTRDPAWAVLGSAGALPDGTLAIRMTDPRNQAPNAVPVPARCISLDEAFLVVRADANLTVSRDLSGFHLYATDLCLIADILGWSSWVIDFRLHHLSSGNTGGAFASAGRAMIQKYRRALRPRIMATTCTTMPLTASPILTLLGRSTKGLALWRRLLGSGWGRRRQEADL